jgi:pentatricopeptide repeat protein
VLLKGYCSARRLREAHAVVADMEKAGVALDVVSYNTMVNGCIEVDDNAAALGYFKKMREAGISPSAVSYTTLMKAFGRNSQPKQVHLVFEEMRSDPSVKTDAVAWNVLLDSYCRNGRAADAKRMFLTMKQDRSAHSLSLPTCIPVSAQSMCRRSSSLRISTLPVPGW